MVRVFSPMVVRPMDECFSDFKIPSKVESIHRRLVSNIDYFKANYLLLIALMNLILVLTRPSYIFGLAYLCGTITYFTLHYRGNVLIGDMCITRQFVYIFILVTSYIFMAVTGGPRFYVLTILCFVLPCLHAVMRKELLAAKLRRITNQVASPTQFEMVFEGFLCDLFRIEKPAPKRRDNDCTYNYYS